MNLRFSDSQLRSVPEAPPNRHSMRQHLYLTCGVCYGQTACLPVLSVMFGTVRGKEMTELWPIAQCFSVHPTLCKQTIWASGLSRKTPQDSRGHIHRQINTAPLQALRSRKLVWHDRMKINTVNTINCRIMEMNNMCSAWVVIWTNMRRRCVVAHFFL